MFILLHHLDTPKDSSNDWGEGVLADTMLGVKYNEQSGDIRLKILLLNNE